jgi:hypothetical protein
MGSYDVTPTPISYVNMENDRKFSKSKQLFPSKESA